MTTIELICPAGHAAIGVPPAALLIEVLDATPAADDAAATAHWVCLECHNLVPTRVGWTALSLLTTVGAHLLDDLEPVEDASPRPPYPLHTQWREP
jgi:hypothetical protein